MVEEIGASAGSGGAAAAVAILEFPAIRSYAGGRETYGGFVIRAMIHSQVSGFFSQPPGQSLVLSSQQHKDSFARCETASESATHIIALA